MRVNASNACMSSQQRAQQTMATITIISRSVTFTAIPKALRDETELDRASLALSKQSCRPKGPLTAVLLLLLFRRAYLKFPVQRDPFVM